MKEKKTFNIVKKVRDIAAKYYSNSYFLAGESVSTYDLMDTITADNIRVNLIAIGAVFLVLLIAFKSLLIPVILVLSIETAIWINLGVPYFIDDQLMWHYLRGYFDGDGSIYLCGKVNPSNWIISICGNECTMHAFQNFLRLMGLKVM